MQDQTTATPPETEIMFDIRYKKQNISVTKTRLFQLALTGELLPDDVISVAGKKIFADSVEGIVFDNKPIGTIVPTPPSTSYGLAQPAVEPPVAPVTTSGKKKKTTWYYYDEAGNKIGPFTNRQFKNLAAEGVINPETRIENEEGQSTLAKRASALRFAAPAGIAPSPFGTNEPVVQIAREALATATAHRTKSVLDEIGEHLDSPVRQSNAWLREKYARHKIVVLSSAVAIVCLLGIVTLFASGFFQKSPQGIIRITGTLTLDGHPVSGVSVYLHPRDEGGESARGRTDARGRFTVTTGRHPFGTGAREGEYDVTFTREERNASGQTEYIIPQRYQDTTTSGLDAIRVEARGTRHFTFDLESEESVVMPDELDSQHGGRRGHE